jgi:hypothetical protein
METDGRVEKQKNSFSTRPCKTPAGVSHSSHRLNGRQSTNNKTGHFTCYQNRTFSFATDRFMHHRLCIIVFMHHRYALAPTAVGSNPTTDDIGDQRNGCGRV